MAHDKNQEWRPRITSRPVRFIATKVRQRLNRLHPVERARRVMGQDHQRIAKQVQSQLSRLDYVDRVTVDIRGKMGASWKIVIHVDSSLSEADHDKLVTLVDQMLEQAWMIAGSAFGSYSVLVDVDQVTVDVRVLGLPGESAYPQDLVKRYGDSPADTVIDH